MLHEFRRYRVNIAVEIVLLSILATIIAVAADNDSKTETTTGTKTETKSGASTSTGTSTSSSTSTSTSAGVSVTAPMEKSTPWSNRSKDHKSKDRNHTYTYNYTTSKDGYRIEKGSGNYTVEKHTLEPFTGIVLESGMDVEVVIGPTLSAEVEIDDNLHDHIILEVFDDDLIISSEGGYSTRFSGVLRLTTPTLEYIRVDGSGDIDLSGLKGGEFTYELKGSGNFFLTGEVDLLEVDLSGSGEVDTRDCMVKDAFIELKGSGTVRVSATKLVDARLAGSGDIHVYGKPARVRKDESGSGNIFVH